MKKFKNAGFTLAEVLITLLIIGVVASLVIPGLINNTNDAEYNASLKKMYADLSNAITMIQAINNGSVNIGNNTVVADLTLLRNDFCNVMTCTKTDTSSNIFGASTNYRYYKGSTVASWTDGSDPAPSAVLSNGNFVRFISRPDCNGYSFNACGWLWVDVNGKKGPNMYGKDLYRFWIVRRSSDGSYTILPFGFQGDVYAPLPGSCASGSNYYTTSEGCAAKRLLDPDNMP